MKTKYKDHVQVVLFETVYFNKFVWWRWRSNLLTVYIYNIYLISVNFSGFDDDCVHYDIELIRASHLVLYKLCNLVNGIWIWILNIGSVSNSLVDSFMEGNTSRTSFVLLWAFVFYLSCIKNSNMKMNTRSWKHERSHY